MITKIKTKANRDGELTVNGLCSLMVKENKITKAAEIKTEPTAPNINDQIAEFFKSGGKIKVANPEDRGMQEWVWWQETYPVNYNKRR